MRKKYVIFAGPNMVKQKLIMDIAKMLKKMGHILRGAFKPLTFPYRSKKYETRG